MGNYKELAQDLIQIGEYVRDDFGFISKVADLTQDADGKILYICENRVFAIPEYQIKKHSFNIKNILEAGDFVNGKEITDVVQQNIFKDGEIKEEQIKSILTHDAIERNTYEVK